MNLFYRFSIPVAIAFMASCYPAKKIATTTPLQFSKTADAIKKAFQWQEAHPIFEKNTRDWTTGAYYTGVIRADMVTQDRVYRDALIAIGRKNNWMPGDRFYHADDMVIGNIYLYLRHLDITEADTSFLGRGIREHLFKPHEWRNGSNQNEQVILWWWCDALFMAPPLITRYARITGNATYVDDMYLHYKETYDLLYDKDEMLFARDNRFLWKNVPGDLKEANGKKIFWSRGNGWVFAGLALLLEDLPKGNIHYPFFFNLYKEMAARIATLQQSSGLWHTSLLSPASFPHGEASGTGFDIFALAWGVNHGLLDSEVYKPVIIKGWKALLQCQQPDGRVGWVQNIGADPRPSDANSWQNFGTGAFLMAGSEILKLAE